MPDDMLDEIDDRRHSRIDRSEWVREAILVRLLLEDDGDWDAVLQDAKSQNSVGLAARSD